MHNRRTGAVTAWILTRDGKLVDEVLYKNVLISGTVEGENWDIFEVDSFDSIR